MNTSTTTRIVTRYARERDVVNEIERAIIEIRFNSNLLKKGETPSVAGETQTNADANKWAHQR